MQGTAIDRDEEVRQLAYRIWQEAGCPNGSDLQHWLQATELWREIHSPKSRPKPTKAKKPRQTRTLKTEL